MPRMRGSGLRFTGLKNSPAQFLLISNEMSHSRNGHSARITRQVLPKLHTAIQEDYDRLIAAARSDWQSMFAASDPSDACIRIHISEEANHRSRNLPRAGFLPVVKKLSTGKIKRRLA